MLKTDAREIEREREREREQESANGDRSPQPGQPPAGHGPAGARNHWVRGRRSARRAAGTKPDPGDRGGFGQGEWSDSPWPGNAPVWPALTMTDRADIPDSLQRWTPVVGKFRRALAPMASHWWPVPTTSCMHTGGRRLGVEFDFCHHGLEQSTTVGRIGHVPSRAPLGGDVRRVDDRGARRSRPARRDRGEPRRVLAGWERRGLLGPRRPPRARRLRRPVGWCRPPPPMTVDLGEFILPCRAERRADDGDTLLACPQRSDEAATELARWHRAALAPAA